ncbi:SMP-30/gluconolactonase/LRE family protein [Undibacterium sp. Ji83W]|uniref:NHL domain-containing protein n=1 Tax=Undibacterium sp. Ji83W TaxID=3413043 RepID=UPI003BF0787D
MPSSLGHVYFFAHHRHFYRVIMQGYFASISRRASWSCLPLALAFVSLTWQVSVQAETQGTLRLLAGSGDAPSGIADGPASVARFNTNFLKFDAFIGTAIDSKGKLFVTDPGNHTIRQVAADGAVSTLAGKAEQPGSTDGAIAQARFRLPSGMAFDKAGNLYVADSGNHSIRKISLDGMVSTVAGKAGAPGTADGPAAKARFNTPTDVKIDAAGNLYVADFENHSIRKITPDGMVSTWAGASGKEGDAEGIARQARFRRPKALAFDPAGNLIVNDAGTMVIRRITPDGHVSTLSVGPEKFDKNKNDQEIEYGEIDGMVADADGNVYVADRSSGKIRRITSSGDVVTFVKNKKNELFSEPSGLIFSPDGDIFICQRDGNILTVKDGGIVVSLSGPIYPTVSQDGPALEARFSSPSGITADHNGNLYLTDYRHTIRKISSTGVVSTIAGMINQGGSSDGNGVEARFNMPSALALDSKGNLYVSDQKNHNIRKIDTAGVVTTFAGKAGESGSVDGAGATTRFNNPIGLAIDKHDNLYVADNGNNQIRKINPTGLVTTLMGKPSGSNKPRDGDKKTGHLVDPIALTIDPTENLYVTDRTSIRKITPGGKLTTIAGNKVSAGIIGPHSTQDIYGVSWGITIDHAGNLLVSDYDNDVIRKISPKGKMTTIAGIDGYRRIQTGSLPGRLYRPMGITTTGKNNFAVISGDNVLMMALPGNP